MAESSSTFDPTEVGKMIENRFKSLRDRKNYTEADVPKLVKEIADTYFLAPRTFSREEAIPTIELYVRMILDYKYKITMQEAREMASDAVNRARLIEEKYAEKYNLNLEALRKKDTKFKSRYIEFLGNFYEINGE